MGRLKLSLEKDSVVVEESQELLAIALRMSCFGLTLGKHHDSDSWRARQKRIVENQLEIVL